MATPNVPDTPHACRVVLLLLLLALAGCGSLSGLTTALNERNVESCVYTRGFTFPFLYTQTITATGGATLEVCGALWE